MKPPRCNPNAALQFIFEIFFPADLEACRWNTTSRMHTSSSLKIPHMGRIWYVVIPSAKRQVPSSGIARFVVSPYPSGTFTRSTPTPTSSPFSPADESGSPVPSGARQLQVSGTKKEEPPPFKGQLKDDQVSQKPSPKSICIAEQKRIERRKAWDLLLHKRPRSDDDMAMSAWLMKVMAVSDPAHSVNFIKLEQVYGQLPSKGRKRGRKDDSNENGHGHQDASSHRSWENRETKGAAGSTELFLSADEADSSLSDSSCQDDEKPPAKK